MNLKISVVIPSYRYKNSLKKVLMAINNQTFSPKEIIIIDSSSDDEVSLMLKTLEMKY